MTASTSTACLAAITDDSTANDPGACSRTVNACAFPHAATWNYSTDSADARTSATVPVSVPAIAVPWMCTNRARSAVNMTCVNAMLCVLVEGALEAVMKT